ncbi:MAG: SDR family oxidoreductase [Anaerolineae bacterium]|nr:SDR family oxidoreductase [Anaerolineae bacterium]
MTTVRDTFDLTDRVAVITGGAGLLGIKHAEAVAQMGGTPVLVDIAADRAQAAAEAITAKWDRPALGMAVDITQPDQVAGILARTLESFGRVDILINNAANNPKMEGNQEGREWSRFENFPLATWEQDIAVGLTGAYLCSQVIGTQLAKQGKGVILNIASDLGVIAPDQRIYRKPGLPDDQQPVKPVTYSVVKAGLIGLTRYLSTYWADRGVRANSLSPGGVYNGQDAAFVERLTNLIPMGRMADKDEYQAAVVFLVSDASSYMTGFNMVMAGGRTAW